MSADAIPYRATVVFDHETRIEEGTIPMTAHSRGPINDRAAGLLEAAEIWAIFGPDGVVGVGITELHAWRQAGLNNKNPSDYGRFRCEQVTISRAATVEQATRAEAEKGGEAKTVKLENGKYEFYIHTDGALYCLRHGEDWREFVGDHAVHLLFLEALRGTKERV